VGGDGTGAGRAPKSPPGRYDYSPLAMTYTKEEDNRNLQNSTTLKVEFIDCVFKVRSNESCSRSIVPH
jgi:hypothetical protein